MLSFALAISKSAWRIAKQLPREAAAALDPRQPDRPFLTSRLGQAMLVVVAIALFVSCALPQLIWVRSPSIDAWAVRPSSGPIQKGDLVSFILHHPIAGPKPVHITKYALCLPGDRLTAFTFRSEGHRGKKDAAFFCNGSLLGVSKAYARDGRRLDYAHWTSGKVPAGMVYIGSSYKDGFDSRYFGLVPLSALTRMARVL